MDTSGDNNVKVFARDDKESMLWLHTSQLSKFRMELAGKLASDGEDFYEHLLK